MNKQNRKRVVILGGGFGGVYTALHLEKLLCKRDDFEILLINKENYFVFQPMLAEVVSGSQRYYIDKCLSIDFTGIMFVPIRGISWIVVSHGIRTITKPGVL